MKFGKFPFPRFEGKPKKTAEALYEEAKGFVLQGEFAAAIGRFREAVTAKVPLAEANDKFHELWRGIESVSIRSMAMRDTAIESPEDFHTEGKIRMQSFANMADIARDFNLNGMFMTEKELTEVTTPEALERLEAAFRPAGPPKKNV